VLQIPETRYAYNGEFAIAYQVLGEGPDLIYLPGWVSNVEANWLAPDHGRFINRLASFTRLIVVDRRGTGCSDRLPPGSAPTLDEGLADLKVVLRAVRSPWAAVFGVQESGFLALSAVAASPERFSRLILFGAAATYHRTEETPWAWSDEQWQDTIATFSGTVPSDVAEGYIRGALPSYAHDRSETRRMAMLLALTQAPGAAAAETRAMEQLDLRHLLPSIQVPTLVMHRTDDPVEPIESGHYLAARINGARLAELPGGDALPWVGESEAVLEEIEEFLTGSRGTVRDGSTRAVTTVLFTDLVGSTEAAAAMGDASYRALLERHHRVTRALIVRHRGVEVDTAGDGFFATFDRPAEAVRCAVALVDAAKELGLEIRAGLHTGEVETVDGKVRGIAVHVGARVVALARPSEVLVTSTVRDVVAGSGLRLGDARKVQLKGLSEPWRVHRVER
jgi:class 3 adenylate cyclase